MRADVFKVGGHRPQGLSNSRGERRREGGGSRRRERSRDRRETGRGREEGRSQTRQGGARTRKRNAIFIGFRKAFSPGC